MENNNSSIDGPWFVPSNLCKPKVYTIYINFNIQLVLLTKTKKKKKRDFGRESDKKMNKLKNSENETAIEFVHIVFSAIINIRTNKFLREILSVVYPCLGRWYTVDIIHFAYAECQLKYMAQNFPLLFTRWNTLYESLVRGPIKRQIFLYTFLATAMAKGLSMAMILLLWYGVLWCVVCVCVCDARWISFSLCFRISQLKT